MISKKFAAKVNEKEKELPIKLRIVLFLLIIYLITIPIFSLSIFYLNKVHHTISKLLIYNVRLERISDAITLSFSEARRFEKRFLVFGDTFYLTLNKDKIKNADSLAKEGEKIAAELGFTEIRNTLSRYRNSIDSLKKLEEKKTRYNIKNEIKRAYPQIQIELNAIIVQMMATEDKQIRDSLMQEFNNYMEGKDTVVDLYAYAQESPEVTLLLEKMDRLENQITNISVNILISASANVETYQQAAIKWAAWGQRIIFLAIIVLSVAIFYLIFNYPKRFAIQLKRITNVLRRIESGEADIKVPFASHDEISEVTDALSSALTHWKEINELKREKILETESKFRLLSDKIQEKIAVIDLEFRIVFSNDNLYNYLNKNKTEIDGKAIGDIEKLASILPYLKNVVGEDLKGDKELLATNEIKSFVIESIRNTHGEITGLLLIIY